jgi:hypothetical protein
MRRVARRPRAQIGRGGVAEALGSEGIEQRWTQAVQRRQPLELGTGQRVERRDRRRARPRLDEPGDATEPAGAGGSVSVLGPATDSMPPSACTMSATACARRAPCSLVVIVTPRSPSTRKKSSITARWSPSSEASDTFSARARRASVWIDGSTWPFS